MTSSGVSALSRPAPRHGSDVLGLHSAFTRSKYYKETFTTLIQNHHWLSSLVGKDADKHPYCRWRQLVYKQHTCLNIIVCCMLPKIRTSSNITDTSDHRQCGDNAETMAGSRSPGHTGPLHSGLRHQEEFLRCTPGKYRAHFAIPLSIGKSIIMLMLKWIIYFCHISLHWKHDLYLRSLMMCEF